MIVCFMSEKCDILNKVSLKRLIMSVFRILFYSFLITRRYGVRFVFLNFMGESDMEGWKQ